MPKYEIEDQCFEELGPFKNFNFWWDEQIGAIHAYWDDVDPEASDISYVFHVGFKWTEFWDIEEEVKLNDAEDCELLVEFAQEHIGLIFSENVKWVKNDPSIFWNRIKELILENSEVIQMANCCISDGVKKILEKFIPPYDNENGVISPILFKQYIGMIKIITERDKAKEEVEKKYPKDFVWHLFNHFTRQTMVDNVNKMMEIAVTDWEDLSDEQRDEFTRVANSFKEDIEECQKAGA